MLCRLVYLGRAVGKEVALKVNYGKNKGFTLVELIIVIAIMAVLVAIITPSFMKYVERAREARDRANVDAVYSAFQLGAIEYSTPT